MSTKCEPHDNPLIQLIEKDSVLGTKANKKNGNAEP